MSHFDLNALSPGAKIHMIGIGGVSMSALATILLQKGFCVSGSDRGENDYIKSLRALGAKITIGHAEENLENPAAVIYTAAVKKDNPELARAVREGIPTAERSVLLGAIEQLYDFPIDVSGTHGKTSTTGMLTHIFLAANTDPTVLIGGSLSAIGGNMRAGGDKYFISEACEYHRSFLQFAPYISIILNVDEDHLDYFKDIEEIKDTFYEFGNLASGAVVINVDDQNAKSVAARLSGKTVITVSKTVNADYVAENIVKNAFGEYSFDVSHGGTILCRVTLHIPGMHHISNALCAFAAAHSLGIAPDVIAKGLSAFTGVKRRFELKYNAFGVRIYDDYAHHPTEIAATLEALSGYSGGKLYLLFQPHTYTRTHALFDDFVHALSRKGVNVVLTDIYAAREKDTGIVSSKMLADKIPGSVYKGSLCDAADYVAEMLTDGDLVMTMGAGDIHMTGDMVYNALVEKNK